MLCKVTFESKHKLLKLITGTLKELIALTKGIVPQYVTRYYLYYIDKDGDDISLSNESDFSIFVETNKQNIHVYVKEEEVLETLSNASCTLQQDSILIDNFSDARQTAKNSSILKGLESSSSANAYQQEQSFSPIKKSNSNTKYSDIPSQQTLLNLSSRRQQIHNSPCNRCKGKQIIGFRYQCPFCLSFNLCEICQKIQRHRHPLLQIKHSGQEIVHSQLRDHLNAEIPSKQHSLLAKQLEEQKKINLNLLKLIEEIDKNEAKSKNNEEKEKEQEKEKEKKKEGIFKKSLFDDDFFKDQKHSFRGSFEERSARRDEAFDSFFEKPLLSQNSRLLNRPRFSYTQPTGSFTRSSRTASYFENF